MAANQVRIQLSTRDTALELPEKPGPILVSTNLGRYELSRLVNSLFNAASPTPFEFLINGTFLRTSIDNFLTAHGISAEALLSLEYVRAQLPPTAHASFEHDDWVGCVDVLSESASAAIWSDGPTTVSKRQERIVSGSFDGLLRLWDMSGRIVAVSTTAHEEHQPKRLQHIMAAKFMSPSLIAAASGTRPQLWQYDEDEGDDTVPTPTRTASLNLVLDCFGHTQAINSLAVHGPSQRFLTASDDSTSCLWSSKINDTATLSPVSSRFIHPLANTTTSAKRRKPFSTHMGPTSGPIVTLAGHTAQVTAVIFHPSDPTAAYTTSRDGTLRTWDLETARCVSKRTPDKPHTRLEAICALPELGLVAAGTSHDYSVLVDPREAATTAGTSERRSAILRLKGHRNQVSALAASPHSRFGLVSGSFDGTCRVWDVRNTSASTTVSVSGDNNETGGLGDLGSSKVARASFRLPRRSNERCDEIAGGSGVKVFDVTWDRDVGIVSASEDKTVQIDR